MALKAKPNMKFEFRVLLLDDTEVLKEGTFWNESQAYSAAEGLAKGFVNKLEDGRVVFHTPQDVLRITITKVEEKPEQKQQGVSEGQGPKP